MRGHPRLGGKRKPLDQQRSPQGLLRRRFTSRMNLIRGRKAVRLASLSLLPSATGESTHPDPVNDRFFFVFHRLTSVCRHYVGAVELSCSYVKPSRAQQICTVMLARQAQLAYLLTSKDNGTHMLALRCRSTCPAFQTSGSHPPQTDSAEVTTIVRRVSDGKELKRIGFRSFGGGKSPITLQRLTTNLAHADRDLKVIGWTQGEASSP